MPLLIYPLGLAATGIAGFFAGSWTSGGWVKWLIILLIIVFLFTQAKKMGLIK